MQIDGERSVVRVRAPGDNAAGAGLLLAPDLVATCAHVVAEAAGYDGVPDAAPGETIEVDLPLVPDAPRYRGRVLRWLPPDDDGGGDVAVVRLETEVSAPVPHLRRREAGTERAFRATGFPSGREDGITAAGGFRDEQGGGWVQLVADDGPRVGSGFSGAPVWDVGSGTVVAMAVGADRDRSRDGVAYALPIDRVLALEPGVLTNPYRGLAAFGEDDAEFFFGRAADVARCLDVLDEHGLVVVAGGSGTGKSSLLHAGIAPAERARGRRPVVARLAGADGADRVTAALAEALARAGSGDWTGVLRGDASAPVGDVLLLVDQFEDLASSTPAAAAPAAEALVRLARAGVRVAVTARWATFDGPLTGDAAAVLQRATTGLAVLDGDGLRQAVDGPARRVPGPSFPPALVDRILADAGQEPGRLPLVQTLLARVWDRPGTDGRLTVEAYERAGGVQRALVESADATWEALDPQDQPVARSLLVDMTRPTDGGFVRAPLPLDPDVDDDRSRVAGRLASARLVTIGRGAAGDVAEMAHQALIDHWPMLRSWLESDAEFLRWRDRLRSDVARWAPERDPSNLLRGAELDVALDRVRERGELLSDTERALVGASRRQRSRNRALRTAAVAVLVVLVLVAGTLAALATTSNRNLTRALDTANARTLGGLARERMAGDPAVGTQLALAAYAADPDDPDARTALGQAYVTRRSTLATYPVPGGGRNHWIRDDPGSDVAGLSTTAGAVLATELDGPAPRFEPIPGSSPTSRPVYVLGGGRWVVLVDLPAGTLRVWDRQGTGPLRVLGTGITAASQLDGTRLLVPTPSATGTVLRIVDVATGVWTAATGSIAPMPDASGVVPTPDPARVLVTAGKYGTAGYRLTLRDARSGAVLVAYPPSAVPALDGSAVVRCDGTSVTGAALVVEDTATGAVRRRVTTSGVNGSGVGCGSSGGPTVVLTGDGRHAAWLSGSSSTVDIVQLVDLTDGRRSSAWVPASVGVKSQVEDTTRSAVIGNSPALTVRGDRLLVPDADGMSVLALSPVPSWRDTGRNDGTQVIPIRDASTALVGSVDASSAVRVSDGTVLGRLPADVSAPGETLVGASVDRVHDVLDLVTSSGAGLRVREFSLPSFRPAGEYDLTSAGAAGVAGSPGGGLDAPIVVLERRGDHVAVLAGGTLSWWSAGTHRLLAPPVVITRDPRAVTELINGNRGGIEIGGPDDDRVAIRLPGELGGLSVYRLGDDTPARIPAELLPTNSRQAAQMGRDVLSTLEDPGKLVQRDVTTGSVTAPDIAVPATTKEIIGTDGSGRLVTVDADIVVDVHALEFWDPRAARTAGRIDLPNTLFDVLSSPSVQDGHWDVDTHDDVVSISVDDRVWHDLLCRSQDRPFTDAELALLPAGADRSAPCTTS